ncbi:hypothetical protein [Streptomyces sp. NPDC054958]
MGRRDQRDCKQPGTEHRTGVCIGNQKARRDRLDAAQLAALAYLGVDWAAG